MAIDYDRLKSWPFAPIEQHYSARDTILYALGVGLGSDPLDERQLRFVYEKDLAALPSMCVVLAGPGFWLSHPDTGVDWVRVLHGEQSFELSRPLPVEATVVGQNRVAEIIDKGPSRGALILTERVLRLKETGEQLAVLRSTTFARGDGGFGGPAVAAPAAHRLPERPPDASCVLPTLPQAALIYRLSGDDNPLHADPAVAREAGFRAPILHGLCTLGIATHAILRTCCDYDPTRLKSLALRFSAPVYPGEPITTDIWRDGPVVSFQARVTERDAVVLNNGRAELFA